MQYFPAAWVVLLVKDKLIGPIRKKWILDVGGGSVHGNGTPTEHGQGTSNLEDGGSLGGNTQGGFTDHLDEEGTQGFIPEDGDQGSIAKVAMYLKYPETYLTGLLMYGLHSSLETLKDGLPKPTPAKKTLWYLLFGNIGTLIVLFIMLVRAPRGSAKERFLVKCMSAAGVLLFGLNLALLYLKYKP